MLQRSNTIPVSERIARDNQATFEYSLAMEMIDMFGPDAVEGFDAVIEKREAKFGATS